MNLPSLYIASLVGALFHGSAPDLLVDDPGTAPQPIVGGEPVAACA